MGYYNYRSKDSQWGKYVSVAERKNKAAKHAKELLKKGIKTNPVVIEGRTISKSFWGKSWCINLESYSDYSNRLPRGRTYVRNGSVIDLQIFKGKIEAQVMGSSLYKVLIEIKPMIQQKWEALVKACSGKIDSLIELLQGKFSKSVMEIITKKDEGLFPKPQEIKMKCSCPDSAGMCKHIAAVLYGIGASLDTYPESLFTLRHVNHIDLITSAGSSENLIQSSQNIDILDGSNLSDLFGIEMVEPVVVIPPVKKTKSTAKKTDKPKTPVKSKTSTKAKKKTNGKELLKRV